MNKILASALLMAAIPVAHATDAPPSQEQATPANISTCPENSPGPTALSFELIKEGARPVLLTTASVVSQCGLGQTPFSVTRQQSYISSRHTKSDGTIMLVPGTIEEGFSGILVETANAPARFEYELSHVDGISPSSSDDAVSSTKLRTYTVVMNLTHGKQTKRVKIDGDRYTLKLDYNPVDADEKISD